MTLPHIRYLLLAALSLLLCSNSRAAADTKGTPVSFDTFDGVTIEGNYYPSKKGKNAACVLLLHDFDLTNGGNCRTAEMDDLASDLQTKGFAVLTFDFRGFGQSTQVKPSFWTTPPNNNFFSVPTGKDAVKRISFKQFARNPRYLKYLVNDIAAARTYLDHENDGGQLNSRRLIVIGAGQGATVGMLWMASEYKRHKAVAKDIGQGPPMLIKMEEESVGEDFQCAIWLSLSANLGNISMSGPLTYCAKDIGLTQKLPMLFIQGRDKSVGAQKADPANLIALSCLNSIGSFDREKSKMKDKDLDLTGQNVIPTDLTGTKLLANEKVKDIITGKDLYLDLVMQRPRPQQWRERKTTDSYFYWKLGTKTQPYAILAKVKDDEMPISVPPKAMNISTSP